MAGLPDWRKEDAVLSEHLDRHLSLKNFLRNFITELKRERRNSRGRSSFKFAKRTAELMRTIIGAQRWTSADKLLQILRAVGRRLVQARPLQLVIANIVRRVLFFIREECARKAKESRAVGGKSETVLERAINMSSKGVLGGNDEPQQWGDLRSPLIDSVNELIDELDNLYEPIASGALDHIHANERVLVYGASHSVEVFLTAAAGPPNKRKRQFEVVVAEAAPEMSGHRMATKLAAKGIAVTVIKDSAIFAMMPRVSKVVMGTHAVVANGGLVATSGSHMVAIAAKQHSVPLVCITGLYKLTPLYPHDQETFNDLLSPGTLMPFGDLPALSVENVQVLRPAYDYVPPDLVDLFITNQGDHRPSYVYRLLAECYHADDILTEATSAYA